MMKLNKKVIADYADKYDSFYLYDENGIIRSIDDLKRHFPQIDFLYSIKCNPNVHILHSIFAQGFGADAASAGEVLMADKAGLAADRIFYSAPGKTLRDIENTIKKSVLIADSIDEIKRIHMVAEKLDKVVNIGLRINPDFTFYGEQGQPSKFGIDEGQAVEFIRHNPYRNIKINGIHVHLKSQELNAGVLAAYYQKMFRLAEKFQQLCNGLEYVNMGSGMGIRYSPTQTALDMPALAAAIKQPVTDFQAAYPQTKIIIEVGRYVVCKSGLYITNVLDRKVSHGKTYLILKNTLNGFVRPSLANMVIRYSAEPSPAGWEPLFTAKDAFEFLTLKQEAASETVTLVGNLCTAADVIAEDISLPYLQCGDSLIITNAGGYAAVLSPMQFSAQEKPAELFITRQGEVLCTANAAQAE